MAEKGQGYCSCGDYKCPGAKRHIKKKLKKKRRQAKIEKE